MNAVTNLKHDLWGRGPRDAATTLAQEIDANNLTNGGTITGDLNVTGTVTAGFISGSVIFNGGTVAGATTFLDSVTVNNTPGHGLNITTTVNDPPTETVTNTMLTNLRLTADNVSDVLSAWRMHIDTGGHSYTGAHSPGVYAEASAFTTLPGGTINTLSGVVGVAGNQGKDTVTNAVSFFSHPDYNTGGGTLVNHYDLLGSVSSGAQNEYGFAVFYNSGIGTTTPVGMLEIRGADLLNATRLLRVRNQTTAIIDIQGDASVLVQGAVTLTNNPNLPLAINTKISDPATTTDINKFSTTVTLTSSNSQELYGVSSHLNIDTGGGGSTFSNTRSTAIYGIGQATDSVAGGTVAWVGGVQGSSGNIGVGTVTNAADFLGRVDFNTGAGGVLTNHYTLFGPSSNKATNEYGFSVAHKSGIGTTTPTALLELRSGDSLNTTLLFKARNNTASVIEAHADSSIGFNAATPITKPTVTGSRGGNAALASLLTALANYGLVTDSTTA